MSSVSSTTFSLRAQDALGWDPLKALTPVQEPQLQSPRAAPAMDKAAQQATPSADPLMSGFSPDVPSTLAMRFEFNAMTHDWMLAMTDSQSGEVVRKINLKVFTPQANGGLHQSGQWIDRVV